MSKTRRRPGIKDLAKSESGVSMVEWGLVLSFLSVLLMGVIELGSAAQYKMQLANAIRVGMQYATVRKPVQGDLSQITASVSNAAPPDATGERELTVTLYCKCPDGSAVDCDDICTGGVDRHSFVSIVIDDVYVPILTLPGTPDQYSLRADGTIRLN